MKVVEVDNAQTGKDFLLLPVELYKDDKNFIRPLDKDIQEVFESKSNKFFRHGECIRWMLYNDDGHAIGRVATFIDHKTAKTYKQPTGGMGFFECINNQEAAFMLFDTCKKWLEAKEMEAMDGPINFGERDKWWGLLVKNFAEPNYTCNYNFPYYQLFFEAYGFKTYFEQYTYYRNIHDPLAPKYIDKAARILANPKYHFHHIKKNNLEKYAEDFRYIYNLAWVSHSGIKGMPKLQAMAIMNKLKPILDEQVAWFAYYDKEPIGFYIMLPELNQFFKHLNGKLDLLGKLKFLYQKWMHTNRKLIAILFGVIPKFQKRGVDAAMIQIVGTAVQRGKRYYELELNWIGDFNPKMIRIAEDLGARKYKTHITYRKLFDSNATFERAPMID